MIIFSLTEKVQKVFIWLLSINKAHASFLTFIYSESTQCEDSFGGMSHNYDP